jgi:uncharacterized protein (DUF2147 family)
MKKTGFIAAFICLSLMVVGQQEANKKILGIWWNEEKTSRIEVFEENNKIYGKIVWLEDNTNPDGTAPRTDFENPDESKRNRKLIGQRILFGLEWDDDDNEWDDGEIYDPENGKTYSCYAKLQKDGTFFLKGYVLGMPFLGRSTLWTRYNGK